MIEIQMVKKELQQISIADRPNQVDATTMFVRSNDREGWCDADP